MGLRERNAAQTRELILHTAIDLFVEQGYEETTMEQIAARAEIGASTLYRYFPTKDQLVVEPIALRGQMAAELLARPADEPLDLALGHALVALVSTPRPDTTRLRLLLGVVDATPALQVRMLGVFMQERAGLERAIAERLGRPVDDLFCRMTARIAVAVLEVFGNPDDTASPDDNAAAVREAVSRLREVLAVLHAEPPGVPRLEA